jgi:hypothetical protein
MLAYILEKFHTWSDKSSSSDVMSTSVSLDDFCTNLMIYYLTNTIGSSMRLYYEARRGEEVTQLFKQHVKVPVAVAIFRSDVYQSPREWMELTNNIQQWTYYSKVKRHL